MSTRLSEIIIPIQEKLDAYHQARKTISERHHLWDSSVRVSTYNLLKAMIEQGPLLDWDITTEESTSKIRSIVVKPPVVASRSGIELHVARLAFVPIHNGHIAALMEYPHYEGSRTRVKGIDTVSPDKLKPTHIVRSVTSFIVALTAWEQSDGADSNDFDTLP